MNYVWDMRLFVYVQCPITEQGALQFLQKVSFDFT